VPDFTPKQIDAIDITRLGEDACIVAGPGSGKTTVLVERYRQLVESGIPPREILAITFTEKAAANMKDKMARAFAAQLELRRQIEVAYISTVHGFCQRLLKENAIAAGVDPQFAILDERQGQIRRARCAVETLDTFLRERPDEAERLMATIDQADLAAPLVEVHDAIRSAGVSIESLFVSDLPDIGELLKSMCGVIDEYRRFMGGRMTQNRLEFRAQLVEWAERARWAYRERRWDLLVSITAATKFKPSGVHPDWAADFARVEVDAENLLGCAVAELYAGERRALVEILRRFDVLYTEEKLKLGALDFSDLEHFAIRLLEENPDVRERVQSQFRQILMDEYQDTNGQQARLLQLLRARGNFYAVGDINQSIFGFRYATPEVFRRHRDSVQAAEHHHVELFENFRSRAEILYAVEALMNDATGVEPHELNAQRVLPVKAMPSIEATAALGETREDADRTEAEWIASRILELRGALTIGADSRPADFRDMAVLVRKTSILEPLMEAFDRFGVQYQVTRQVGFFEAREIRDLMHLLRAISNPRDEVSLAVVLRSPLVGLSDEALMRLKTAGDNLGAALDVDVANLDPLDGERWQRFKANFTRWRAAVHYVGLDRLLAQAMADCGYSWVPGSASGANIEKLLALARHAPREQSLAEFVQEIKLIRDEEAREADAPFDEALDAVRVITAHASKGLEFPIVFIPAMQTRMNMSIPALTFTTGGGLGTKWRNPDGGEALSDWFRTQNKAAIREREMQESNRLLYVAMTRAEEHLVLSYGLGPKDKAQQWAEPVCRVFDMASLEPDAPVRIVHAGCEGRQFEVAVRCLTRTPAALAAEGAAAFASRIEEMESPKAEAQQESDITVTSLTLFADCPRRYYLARYLGWESEQKKATATMPSAELGRQVHALLASQPVDSPEFEALHLAETFDRSELGRRVKKARRVEHELDFMFAIDEMIVRGQIDLWFEDRGGHVIVDYKTDDIGAQEVEARSTAYELQLRFYALAIEKLTGQVPAEAWLHFLRPDVALRVDLRRADLEDARRLVGEMAEAQRRSRFPLNEGTHCLRCPFYRGKCPAGTSREIKIES
jgi:ATP-dependent exoDNAse (exonuclease V) beta subunit